MEDVGPDCVIVEGDLVSNKDFLGFKSALSERGMLGDL